MLICSQFLGLSKRAMRSIGLVLLGALGLGSWLCESTTQAQERQSASSITDLKSLRTAAEKSSYLATAKEKEVLQFLQILDQSSPFASQIQIGSSSEGRPIQSLIIAKEPSPILPLAANDKRLVILLLGGIHSGECDGKEALLALARDLLIPTTPKYLDQAVLIFVPNFNPDGNERVGTQHRPGQEGPDLGMGTRENALGLDLNRDFIKLDTPEVRAVVRAIDTWDVDVLIDAHTTNGSLHQYDLTYDIPHNPIASATINRWLRKEMLPAITTDLTSKGLPTFYYGNFSPDHKRWESFGHEPRYSTEYMALRGKIGILSESYSYATYQRRVEASYAFIDACLKQLTDNSQRLRGMLQRMPSPPPKSVPIQAKITADEAPAIAKGYAWNKPSADENNPSGNSGQIEAPERGSLRNANNPAFPGPRDRKRKTEMTPKDFDVQLVNVGLATQSVDAPEFYFIGVDDSWAASRLRLHGVQMSWIDANAAAGLGKQSATQYRIANRRELNDFQSRKLRRYDVQSESVAWTPSPGWLISTRQPLGALATYLLEPHSDDSLATWGFFEPRLSVGSLYPIVRIDKLLAVPMPLKPIGLTGSPAPELAKEPITLEKIFDPKKKISQSNTPVTPPRWLKQEEAYLVQQEGRWMVIDCKTGAAQPFDRTRRLVDALTKLDAFKSGQANDFLQRINAFDANMENALIEHRGDLYLFHAGSTREEDSVRQITHSPNVTKELWELSPTGKHVAFVQDQDLWVADCTSTEVKKLTTDGGGEILNGKLDWVYQEEVYGRGIFKGYWWSPNGEWIAFLKLDESSVPRFRINNSLSFAQNLEEMRYPKAGQPNPLVSLHVVQVATGKTLEVPLQDYPIDDRLVVRVGWHTIAEQPKLIYQVQNRIQNKLDVWSYDLQSQKTQVLVRETSTAWVDVIDVPRWLPDDSFLWLSDGSSGRRHVYRIGKDGSRTAITEGDWDVKSIESVAPDGKFAWIVARRSAPVNSDLLRIDLTTQRIEPMGELSGSHRVSFHPNGRFYFDSWSDIKNPAQMWLCDSAGQKLRSVYGYRSDRIDYLQAAQTELFEITARDGFGMQALLYKPSDFTSRTQNKKMPVLIYVYGGPAAPTVENASSRRYDLWHRFMAEQGICVLLCDNRSALGRGNAGTWKVYRDLGSAELRDLEDAVQWLGKQPWVDTDRIGLWGWSYGGYFTSYAMTHSQLFRAGIAGAPVTDWNNYDSIYTERYMDTPKGNPDGYKSSSVVEAAKNLHGRLLLIHGEIDDNVHMTNTMQLVYALQKANKPFDLMVYPNNRHGIVDADQTYHQFQMMTNFFEKHLLGR